MEIVLLKLLTVAAVIGYIVWEIVKLYRDPELQSKPSPPDGEEQN